MGGWVRFRIGLDVIRMFRLVQFNVQKTHLSLPQRVQTGSRAHLAIYPMGTEVFWFKVKCPSSAQPYLHSPIRITDMYRGNFSLQQIIRFVSVKPASVLPTDQYCGYYRTIVTLPRSLVFTMCDRKTASVTISFRLSAWNNSASTAWIYTKFYIWGFFENLS